MEKGIRLSIAVAALAVATLLAAGLLTSSSAPTAAYPKFDKRYLDPDATGAKAQDLAGNYGEPKTESESEAEDPASPAWEKFQQLAFPGDTVPVAASQKARATWDRFRENNNGQGGNNTNNPLLWDLIGPTHATQPGILSFSGAQLHMAGRTTGLAITPTCTTARCRLWIGAAGGGVWRTDNPLSPDPSWVFVSKSFKTNAIGTLDQDPNDSTGNTLYAGTGEPNASGDSEAGVGIYKTTDGGNTWTLLPGSTIFDSRSISKIVVVPGEPNHLYVGVARGVRGVTSVAGGAFSRRGPCVQGPTGLQCGDSPDQAVLGLYESKDGGATFNLIWAPASLRGVNDVGLDPQNPATVYAAAFHQGIWRCAASEGCADPKNTAMFKQVFESPAVGDATTASAQVARTQFDLTVKDGKTRIYAADGGVGTVLVRVGGGLGEVSFPSSFWRVDDANALAAPALVASQASPNDGIGWDRKSSTSDAPRSATYREAYNYCTGQCWYDNDVYTPKGFPDVVYLLGSYSYGELRGPSNARGLLLSTTAGEPNPALRNSSFNDMTWDFTPPAQPDLLHPDFHEIVTPSGNPLLFFVGNDGGVFRNDGAFDDASGTCTDPQIHPGNTGNADNIALCRRLLSRIPHQLFDTLNKGLSTLQFQSVSVSPKQPLHDVQGGTQDNGTFDWDGQLTQWEEIIYGDGGQSGFNYCNDQIRFNTFFTQYTDENFRGGQQKYWVVTSGPLFNETAPFYMAEVTDYNNCGPLSSFPGLASPAGAAANANTEMDNPRLGFIGFQFAGLQHVWRTVDNGGPQDYLEANCPEFTTFGDDARCGDWKPLGDPFPAGGAGDPGDLTSTQYGPDRTGGTVAAVERRPTDNNTLWAATSTGRVFVSHNVNAVDPASVQFCRVDFGVANAPFRFISSIYPDPNNPDRAFISYSGYNTNDPAHPGHVFEVTAGAPLADPDVCPGTWRDLNVESGSVEDRPDIPITDLVRDDFTLDLYAATDFGVVRGTTPDGGLTYTWTKAGTNLPFVEVPGLTIDPCSRVLYAATHGRSVWRMFLPPAASAPSTPCPRTP